MQKAILEVVNGLFDSQVTVCVSRLNQALEFHRYW